MRGNNDLKFPVTIEELKDFCEIKGISLYQHNFYLGSDHIGANAHGIYKDYWSGDFIVYRNMEDGSKEVIYQGQDEAAAVKETCRQLLHVIKNPDDQDIYDVDGTNDNILGGVNNTNIVEDTVGGQEEYSTPVEESISDQEEYSNTADDSLYSQEENIGSDDENVFAEEENECFAEDGSFYEENNVSSDQDNIFDNEKTDNTVTDSIFHKEENRGISEDNTFSNEDNESPFGKSIFDNDYSYNSSSDLFNTKNEKTAVENKSSENSWMDIDTPLMKAAPNEDVEENGEDNKASDKSSFTIDDVNDLKSGLLFFLGKAAYYISRFFYYISGVFFCFSRIFVCISQSMDRKLNGHIKSGDEEYKFGDFIDEIKCAVKRDIDADKSKADDTQNFADKDFDQKILYLWDKTKYYTSRFSIHLSRLFLRFGNYCYKDSQKQDDISKDDKIARDEAVLKKEVKASYEVESPKTEKNSVDEVVSLKKEEIAAKEIVSLRKEDNTAEEVAIIEKEDEAIEEAVNQIKAEQVVNEVFRNDIEYSEEYVNVNEETDRYVQHVGGNGLFDTEGYDLKKKHDHSLNDLIGSLDEDNYDYSDYNDDFDDETIKHIGRFIAALIIAIVFLILMFASKDSSSNSYNHRSGYNSHYNNNSYGW